MALLVSLLIVTATMVAMVFVLAICRASSHAEDVFHRIMHPPGGQEHHA